jgi:FMN phosphatase YigB (HAD superfamily)
MVFDVGETLVDETRNWEHVADACGVPRFTLMALVGATIARGESHRLVNDVEPALAAGMVSVHIRRGPWGYLLEPPAGATRIRSLDELPAVLR